MKSSCAQLSRWLLFPKRQPLAKTRLVVFHHAGGSAGVYFKWHKHFRNDVELALVELPGRSSRHNEPYLESFDDSLRLASSEILRTDLRLSFFGHSMGALLALETARLAQNEGRTLDALFVSACDPPIQGVSPVVDWRQSPRMSDSELVERYVESLPQEIVSQPEFLRRFLRTLRADVQLLSTYRLTATQASAMPHRILRRYPRHPGPSRQSRQLA